MGGRRGSKPVMLPLVLLSACGFAFALSVIGEVRRVLDARRRPRSLLRQTVAAQIESRAVSRGAYEG